MVRIKHFPILRMSFYMMKNKMKSLANEDEKTKNDRERFDNSLKKFLDYKPQRSSIGILKEKSIHLIVKDFYAGNDDYKEVPINGYVADIYNGERIIEIQNGNFYKMRDKLASFLPDYHVDLVLPMQYHKTLSWIDPESGEISKKNKSPITGNPYMAFKEFYRIKTFLKHPNLSLVVLLIDYDEYRLMDGWSANKKRGSHRYDRIPIRLEREIRFDTLSDFGELVPDSLDMPFTIKELSSATGVKRAYLSQAVTVLSYLGVIKVCGKRGRMNEYVISDGSYEESFDVNSMVSDLRTNYRKRTMKMNKFQKETVIERFLRYVKVDTQSDENTNTSPSTPKQHDLAKLLANELEKIGVSDVTYDKEHCYIYASIPSNLGKGKKAATIGFIAHMDTSDAVSGKNVNPSIVSKFDGKDICLNKKENVVLSSKDFPELLNHIGEDLIVTDGTTLLGADDKAGIAEIMELANFLILNPDFKHGPIKIAFSCDEEIGEGTKYFDIKKFGADFAYTVDGGKLGQLEYENFNAAEAQLIIKGRSVHPGDAKGKMVSAALIAFEFQSLLPAAEDPMYTEKREGFYHLVITKGTVEKAVSYYIIRDHDMDKFNKRKELFKNAVDFLNQKYGEGTVELTMEDSYYNMIEKIRPHMHLIENARKAMTDLGITPLEDPIRGGTDGATLSFKGLPCPNLCTGGYNYHGKYEYASVQEMYSCVEILKNIVKIYSDYKISTAGTKSVKTATKKGTTKKTSAPKAPKKK